MLVEISKYIHDKIINVMIRYILLIINILCHVQALVTNFCAFKDLLRALEIDLQFKNLSMS